MPDYLTKYASGLRYFRAVPKQLRDVIGRDDLYESLGKVPHREAQSRAVVLAALTRRSSTGCSGSSLPNAPPSSKLGV